MLLKALVVLVMGVVVLPFSQQSAAAPTSPARHGKPTPGPCRMLPANKQPRLPAHGVSGNLIVVVPATTCNTPH